ncbi:MAG: PaaI family thioesterase [Chlamydiia bacterium]|nr:PaaI family thioesterase [Chlamydiia bacterium]
MSIWYNKKPFAEIDFVKTRSMMDHLGIEFLDRTENSLVARMPINEKTKQPFGIMHGGASAALAETVGSIAANMTLNTEEERAVGLELNISHLKMVKEGWVTATATPIKLGSTIQIWEIKVQNDEGKLVSHSKLTMMVLKNR